jgi:Ca-activated chloride channel family protein
MMAEDVDPNRLEAAKRAIEKLADKFSDDRLALVVFAGEAYIQLPITSDMTSAKMFLKSISPGSVAEQGTSLSKAIETSLHAFTGNPETGKVMILITDGEDHEGQAIESYIQQIRQNGL